MKYFLVFALVVTGFFSTNIEKVEAVSWQNMVTVCTGRPSERSCMTHVYFTSTVNANKTTYAPGETITLTASMRSHFCSNYVAVYSLSAAIGGNTTSLASLVAVGGGGSHYSSGTLTAPTTPGTYNISLTSCHYVSGIECATANIPITVSGTLPPPPPPPPPPATATISGTACEIQSGDSTCTGTLTWNISGASNPNVYNNNGTTYANTNRGTDENVLFGFGLNAVFARDGASHRADTNIVINCASGLVWVGGVCGIASAPVPPPPTLSINLSRDIVRSGETVVTNTNVTAAYPLRCTLYGVLSSPIVFTHAGNISSTATYPHTTRPLTSAQIVTVTCEPSPAIAGVPSATAENRISVIPTVEEI